MPTRFFDQLDVTNIVQGYTAGPTATHGTISLVNTSFSNFNLSGSGSDITVNFSIVTAGATYRKTATVNFQSLPPIRNNSTISKVTVFLGATVTGDVDATVVDPDTCHAEIDEIGAGGLQITGTSLDPSHAHYTNTQSFNGTSDIIYDPPITYAQLVTNHGTVTLELVLSLFSRADNAAFTGATATASYLASITNWGLEVTWEEAPFDFQVGPADHTITQIQPNDIISVTGILEDL